MKTKRRGLVFTPNLLKKMGNQPGHNQAQEPSQLGEILSRTRRIKEKGMNKTEKEFSELLEEAARKGEILRWQFEEVTLKIAPSTRYIPDFIAVLPNGDWQVFEIKGHLEDDAAVKFKAAAEKYPEMSFHMLKKQRGQWVTVYNLPSRLNKLNKLNKLNGVNGKKLSPLTALRKKMRKTK